MYFCLTCHVLDENYRSTSTITVAIKIRMSAFDGLTDSRDDVEIATRLTIRKQIRDLNSGTTIL